jgi:RimJ/RimL family protein N-acetyltransferase
MDYLNQPEALGPIVEGPEATLPQPVVLQGRLVSLSPIDPETHTQSLYEKSHGADAEQLWRYLFDSPCSNIAAFKDFLFAKSKEPDRLCFAIVDNALGEAVGMASYMSIDRPNRRIEVGSILFTPPLQSTAGGTEAMYLMARHAFEQLHYRRYEWKCNALNQPSRRAALRYGFQFEGIFRQHMIMKGRNRDTAWFSMLDSEWASRKEAFERWLDPSNFDANGQQRTSLSQLNASTPV